LTAKTEQLAQALRGAFGEPIVSITEALGEVTLVIKAGDLLAVMTVLRDGDGLRFEQLIDACGVDYSSYGKEAWDGTPSEGGTRAPSGDVTPETDATPALDGAAPDSRTFASRKREPCSLLAGATPKGGAGGRFAVVYHLLSLTNNWRLRVRTFATDDELPVVDSVINIWPSANWFEREAFDLFGIIFTGHPDLRRILTDYGFIGHPFRKDFPISGNVEMRYDPDQQRVIYQPVSIEPREIVPRIVREEHYADSEGFRKG
jgi:NADH-quinone oxidoreductase subunit C